MKIKPILTKHAAQRIKDRRIPNGYPSRALRFGRVIEDSEHFQVLAYKGAAFVVKNKCRVITAYWVNTKPHHPTGAIV